MVITSPWQSARFQTWRLAWLWRALMLALRNSHGGGSLVGNTWSIQMLSATEEWMREGISPAADANQPPSGLPQASFQFVPMYRLQNGQ
jgi:hypothetical protein